ncbi:MAG TPA: site-specific integrase [Victivallales bacterium]|nr:site-specific integrase [Victivallales bacterium]
MERISAKKMAPKIAKILKKQNPNYDYIRDLFKFLRQELDIKVTTVSKSLPYVPTESEIKQLYKVIWESHETKHMLIVKVLLYTGVRVSELINIKINDINLESCQIRINKGKGNKDRIVPFSPDFKETLALHMKQYKEQNRKYLFESSFHNKYSDRGIRKILERYTKLAGIQHAISPHKLRHFLFTWLKRHGIDDALIQPYSGHESRQSLEIYSKLSLADAQNKYNDVIKEFPV